MTTKSSIATIGALAANAPLLGPFELGSLSLPNRCVMAAMTRSRTENAERIPTAVEAHYFAQRATAGLMMTGGTFITPQAVGATNVAGIWSEEQIAGWRQVTEAVHAAGGRIFLEIVHSGSVTHPSLIGGELPVAPSAIDPRQLIHTAQGVEPTVAPRELEVRDIQAIVEDYAKATDNAKTAGFDGAELHGSNMFLVPQFLHESTNRRADIYGGSPANRARFVTEVLSAMASSWDHERVGIKLSPTVSGVGEYTAVDYLLQWLSDFEPAYLHMRRGFDANRKPIETLKERAFDHYRERYKGRLIGNGAFDLASANDHLARGAVDLISFATHYIANPDLVARFRDGHPLAQPDASTLYQGGSRGYVDYPAFADVTASA